MQEQASNHQPNLEAFLEQECGETIQIKEMRPLAGGASRETWFVQLQRNDEREALVLRLDTSSTMNPDALTRAEEYRLMAAARSTGVRVPRLRWLCTDPEVLGAPFFLMEYVPGESIGPRVVRLPELAKARSQMPEAMADQLARIHSLDTEAFGFLPRPPSGASPAQTIIDGLRRSLAKLAIHNPGLAAGLRWLERNQPPSPEWCVLHGDFRIGNLIVDEDGLAAIIDWEFAHLGDPVEDVAWPMVRDWRFGKDSLRLGGIAEAGPYLDTYEQKSQRPLDRAAVDYWEIMGNMKWAVTCLVQAQRHLSGQDTGVELASLGRRSAEMEMELLSLIRQK